MARKLTLRLGSAGGVETSLRVILGVAVVLFAFLLLAMNQKHLERTQRLQFPAGVLAKPPPSATPIQE